jgi:hypothetical protein
VRTEESLSGGWAVFGVEKSACVIDLHGPRDWLISTSLSCKEQLLYQVFSGKE